MKTIFLSLLLLFIGLQLFSQDFPGECGTTDEYIQKEQLLLNPLFANLHDFIPWNTGGVIRLIINHLK